MIKFLKSFAALVVCLLSVNSFAGLIIDVEREGAETHLNAGESISWTHNILDQGFTLGTAESASIAIELSDDSHDFGFLPFEVALIQLGRFDFQDGTLTDKSDFWFGNLGVSSLVKLNTDGTLSVRVTSVWGDFILGKSTLSVKTTDAVSVPESSSLVLFALGLLGLGLMRRKIRA